MILFSSAFLSGAVGVKTISYFYLDKLLLPSASWNQPEYDGTLFPQKDICIYISFCLRIVGGTGGIMFSSSCI